MNSNKNKLEIKSHSDELLKEIDDYFKKYPRITSTEDDPSTIELLNKLKEEVEFLQRVERDKKLINKL